LKSQNLVNFVVSASCAPSSSAVVAEAGENGVSLYNTHLAYGMRQKG